MPDSTLAVTHDEIVARVCRFAFGVSSLNALSSDGDRQDVEAMIRAGLRRFYFPGSVDQALNHQWSFLSPAFSFSTVGDQADYEMAGDFGGIVGSLKYTEEDGYAPLRKVSVDSILQYRAYRTSDASGPPAYFAEQPAGTVGSGMQHWRLLFWPTPDSVYALSGEYRVNPDALTKARPHPYGGVEHGETILESCLAVAEERLTRETSVHRQAFLERLKASVLADQARHTPDNLGYMGERLARRYGVEGGLRSVVEDYGENTVGGAIYSG